MIPKMIHYCWFGGKPLPKDVLDCIKTWEKYCPDYEIKRWDESNFDVNSHPFMKAAYEAKAWAFVSDYARLKVIYDNGGIYLDTDVELLKKPDFLLENQCYIGIQQPESLCTTGLGFGAQKSSPVVQKMMECYDSISFTDPPRFFDPLSTGNTKNLLCDETVSIHHYAATWAGNKQRWKRKLIRFFGEDRYFKLKKLFRRVQ